jgi:hypothetical protein
MAIFLAFLFLPLLRMKAAAPQDEQPNPSPSPGPSPNKPKVAKHHKAKGLVVVPGEVEKFIGEALLRSHPAFDVAAQLSGRLHLTNFRLIFLPDQTSQVRALPIPPNNGRYIINNNK